MSSVAILGGGVSGLSAAYYISKLTSKGICDKILLLESSCRLGGWIQTSRHDDGTVFEQGPRSIRGTGIAGENTVQLVDELGLGSDILPVKPFHPAAKNRYIYADGQLHKLPNGMLPMLRRQSPFSQSFVAMCWKEPFLSRSTLEDESIHSFVSRRLGPEVAKYAIDPLCRGIFAGNAQKLSMRSCFPPLWGFEKNHGSLIRGAFLTKRPDRDEAPSKLLETFKREKWSMWSLKGGLEQFTDTLESTVQRDGRVEIVKDISCTDLGFRNGKVQVTCGDQVHEVDHVISSLPAKNLSQILSREHQFLQENLEKIPTVSVAVVNLQYEGNILPVQGFGHLVPSSQPSNVMGVLYESCIFPEHDRTKGSQSTRITCMMGGAWFHELFGEEGKVSLEEFGEIAQEAVVEQMGIRSKPFRVNVTLQRNCIPQYIIGHWQVLDGIFGYVRDKHLPMTLIGSSYEGVSINDCILNAKKHVKGLASQWQS